LRLGAHQIGEALDRGEIELAVLEGAAGELAGLGHTQAVDAAQRLKHGGDDGAAAVQLQLGGVLAGFAVGRRKPQHQRLVDDFLAAWIAHAGKPGLARRRDLDAQRFQRRACARPADADHGNGRRPEERAKMVGCSVIATQVNARVRVGQGLRTSYF
jgi:hypothetical protein